MQFSLTKRYQGEPNSSYFNPNHQKRERERESSRYNRAVILISWHAALSVFDQQMFGNAYVSYYILIKKNEKKNSLTKNLVLGMYKKNNFSYLPCAPV